MQLIAEAYDLLRRGLGTDAGGDRGRLPGLELRRPGVVPHRDHRRGARAHRRRDRQAVRRRRAGPGRAEGHRPLDRADRARPRGAGQRHRRGGVRPLAVRRTPSSGAAAPRPARSGRRTARSTGDGFVEDVRKALYASKIVAYAQGFDEITAGAAEYGWDIDRGAMATIWRGGCIIRARFLNRIKEAYDRDPRAAVAAGGRLLHRRPSADGAGVLAAGGRDGRRRSASRRRASPPRWPTTTGCGRERLPAALIQGLRDLFGAHTYQRVDKDGVFHTLWSADRTETSGE